MSATVPDLAARVLRRLGVSLVAQGDRAAPGPTSTAADVAAMVLRDRGVPVAETDRPTALPPVSQAQIAASAWQLVGIGRASAESLGVVSTNDIVARALRLNGVNPSELNQGFASGTTFALSDVADAALRKLSVIAADEPPSTDDHNEAVRVATFVHESLVADGIAYWPPSAVPYGALEHVVAMTANMLATYFGRPATLESYTAARDMLRVHALSGSMAVQRAQATLTSVHGALAGRGFVDWSQNAIPAGTLEAYVTMVADWLAPVYGKPRDGEQYAAAELLVRRFALSGSLGDTTAAQKVGEVHDALNALGLVSWPVSAVPTAYANDYAEMAATLLPAFSGIVRDAQGRQADAAAWETAVGHVKRGAMIAGMQARALAKVQAVHAEMQGMGLVDWSIDAIPASMTDAYAEAATALMGAESGELDPKAQAAAYERIRMLAMNGPAGQALAEQKVRAVHFDLAGRGKVQWTLLTIPRFAEEPYVVIAAAWLAPEMGLQADMQSAVGAERALARLTMVPSDGRPVVGAYF